MEHVSNEDEDAALQALITERLSRPHRWISQEELMEKLGITEEDIKNATGWVE